MVKVLQSLKVWAITGECMQNIKVGWKTLQYYHNILQYHKTLEISQISIVDYVAYYSLCKVYYIRYDKSIGEYSNLSKIALNSQFL